MNAPSIRHARAATLLVYVFQTVLALTLALPLARVMGSAVSELPTNLDALYAPGGTPFLDVLYQNRAVWGLAILAAFLIAGFAFVASPLVELFWLNAMLRKRPLADSAAAAVRQLGAGIRVTLLLSPFLVLGILACSIGAAISLASLHSAVNERTHDIGFLCSLIPGALILLHWSATHDLARAALAKGHVRARQAVTRALKRSVRALPLYALMLGIALVLTWAGFRLGVDFDRGGLASSLLVVAVQQGVAFARTLARGFWLSSALRRAD